MTDRYSVVVERCILESIWNKLVLLLFVLLSVGIPLRAGAAPLFGEHMEFSFASDQDYPSGQRFTHSAVGDFNEDSIPDIAVPVYGQNFDGTSVSILLGNGDGTFAPKIDVPTATGPWNVATGDLDRDGHRDLAVVSHISGILSVHFGNGDGTFGPRTEYVFPLPLEACALGDLNGDQFPDVVTTSYAGCPATISVRLNNGDGTLSAATSIAGVAPHGVELADLNRDGPLDLIVTNEYAFDASCPHQPTISIAIGNGNGTFQPWTLYPIGDYAHRLAIADFDGVRGPDIVTGNAYWSNFNGTNVSILLNRGDGTFDPRVDYPVVNAIDVDVADFNGDGAIDVAGANWSVSGQVVVLYGNGDGTFHTGIPYDVRNNPNDVNALDLNRDGRTDLVTANPYSNTVSVLLNVGCDPLRNAITGVFPNRGGDVGGVDVSIYGCGFQSGATVKLSRTGETDIEADPVYVGPDGVVEATFDLTGRALGAWDVEVTNLDKSVAVRPAGFTIEPGRPAEVWVRSYGRQKNRAGRPMRASQDGAIKGNVTYHAWAIACHNLSKEPAAIVTIMLGTAFGDASGKVVATPAPPNLGAYTLPWDLKHGYTVEQFYKGLWSANNCPEAVEECVTVYQAQSQGGVSGGDVITNYGSGPSHKGLLRRFWEGLDSPSPSDWPDLNDQFELDLRQRVNCRLEWLVKTFTCDPNADLSLANAGEVILRAVDIALTDLEFCDPIPPINCPPLNEVQCPAQNNCYPSEVATYRARFGQILTNPAYRALFLSQLCELCEGLASEEQQNPPLTPNFRRKSCRPVENLCGIDPNEKTGPSGIDAPAYVTDALPLSYTVNFENLDTATLPAAEVVITDQLDPTKVDLSTLTFGPVSFGDQTATPPPNANPSRIDVDLRPQQDLIVRIIEQVNLTTGVLTCRFESIDPATGLAPDDPTLGFLPPNVTPPEGEGSIRFNVMPRAGIASGTAIPNHASIVFDVNAPLLTNEWLNTIDTSRPMSQVQVLEYLNPDTAVVVHWAGSDEGSGVDDYLVYLSVDDGPPALWRSTGALEDTLAVLDGHRYALYSVARDRVGNVEEPPGAPDATIDILLDAKDTKPLLSMSATNPSTTARVQVTFSLPSTGTGRLDLLDVQGRRVASKAVDRLSPGKHSATFGDRRPIEPGVYFVRLLRPEGALIRRVVVLQ